MLTLVPVTQREAKALVNRLHRHCRAPIASVFQVGLSDGDGLVGVAIAERPKARMSDDGRTLEISRVATNGHRNANSMLYGACARAASALGYTRLLTYTLPHESGASLKASGWTCLGEIDAGGSWEEKRWGGKKIGGSIQSDMWGDRKIPVGPKLKWEKRIAAWAKYDAADAAREG